MDPARFDRLAARLAAPRTRRGLLAALSAVLAVGREAAAARRCRGTGRPCAGNGQCCSGVCHRRGKGGRRCAASAAAAITDLVLYWRTIDDFRNSFGLFAVTGTGFQPNTQLTFTVTFTTNGIPNSRSTLNDAPYVVTDATGTFDSGTTPISCDLSGCVGTMTYLAVYCSPDKAPGGVRVEATDGAHTAALEVTFVTDGSWTDDPDCGDGICRRPPCCAPPGERCLHPIQLMQCCSGACASDGATCA